MMNTEYDYKKRERENLTLTIVNGDVAHCTGMSKNFNPVLSDFASYTEPVLIVLARILTYYCPYILQKKSLARFHMGHKHTIFMISRKPPGSDDRKLCMVDLLTTVADRTLRVQTPPHGIRQVI